MITINSISYTYLKAKAITLAPISLSIKSGEFISILGASGCGKTTLANILAGYFRPQTGEILIDGTKVQKPGKNRIVMNQENDLFAWMTVWEHMKLVERDEKKILKYLTLVGLESYQGYYPSALSGGMKKRLSLARALVVDPEFLILDEPFDSLDEHMKALLHVELDRIFSVTKKTIVLITHDIDEAIFLSDRVIILGGKPTAVVNQVVIDFSHPRTVKMQATEKFAKYRMNIARSYR